MEVRKREDEVFSNAAGTDVGASSHWVAVPARSSDEPKRESGAMTDDLNAMADWQQLARSVAALKRRATAPGFVITQVAAGARKSGSAIFFLRSNGAKSLLVNKA